MNNRRVLNRDELEMWLGTPEAKVKTEVKKQLKALNAYQFWPVQTGMGAPTVDCLACIGGCFIAIETKAPGKKPTPRQELTINAIASSGGKTLVIDSVDMARLLPEILNVNSTVARKQSSDTAHWVEGGWREPGTTP